VGLTITNGDIVEIDEGLMYLGYNYKYNAIILWKDFNNQPLLTKVGEYLPYWGTYESIVHVVGHIDMEKAVKWDG
jgi:hypothetical protein